MRQSILVAREWDAETRSICGLLPPMVPVSAISRTPLVVCVAITGWLGTPPLRLEVIDVTEGRSSRHLYRGEIHEELSPFEANELDPRLPYEIVWDLPPGVISLPGSYNFCLMQDDGSRWHTEGWAYPVLVVEG